MVMELRRGRSLLPCPARSWVVAAIAAASVLSALSSHISAWRCAVLGAPPRTRAPPSLLLPPRSSALTAGGLAQLPPRRLAGLGRAAGGSSDDEDLVTTEEVLQAAKRLNVELREEVLGPWYQMALYSGDKQVGKTSGWAQPWGIMHLETIEVRRFTGYWVQNKDEEGEPSAEDEGDTSKGRYADVSKVARWFGLLLAVSIACWNRERSPFYCKEAELLAIKDEEKQHRRLVRYYRGLGFKPLRQPDDLTMQDQLFWGGEGTLMNVQADEFIRRWTPVVRELAGITR